MGYVSDIAAMPFVWADWLSNPQISSILPCILGFRPLGACEDRGSAAVQIEEALIAGVAGGMCLGLFRLIISLAARIRDPGMVARYKDLVWSHVVLIFIFGVLGGVCSWAFSGRAGDFVQGLTALATITLFAGESLALTKGKDDHA